MKHEKRKSAAYYAQKRAEKEKKQKRNFLIIVLSLAFVLVAVLGFIIGKEAYRKANWDKPTHYAYLELENFGTVKLALYGNSAPITVKNFIRLAKDGFYDGLSFHRIMPGGMMQGGDPEGTGLGGSGKEIKGEFSANGVENKLKHTRGAISMARSGLSMDSASSQFFIVQQDYPSWDGEYACFGYVVEGMDVVDAAVAAAEPDPQNNYLVSQQTRPIIKTITIEKA